MQAKALELKEEGNKFFKQELFQKAIEKYTEAICYQDSQRAVACDVKNLKGYFCMGEALMELSAQTKDINKIQTAIEKLKKSLTLCPSQGKNSFEQFFVHVINKAKKQLWYMEQEKTLEQKKVLRSYLVNLIEKDTQIDQDLKDELYEGLFLSLNKQTKDDKETIPRSLICVLTQELFKNPVCNELGNSYSKDAYQKQITSNGGVDPITKKKLTYNVMYQNLSLKKAVESYLQANPWAYEVKSQ